MLPGTSSSLFTNSLAISSFTPPPILKNGVQRVQFTAKTPRRHRYRLSPESHEPAGIPVHRKFRGWNYDSSHGCTLPDIAVADGKPPRVHNVKDDITDYCKLGGSFWSAAREKRVENAEAQIEAYRMTSRNPFQEASRRHSPFYTGRPVKHKDVAIVPERLPAKFNIRGRNCRLWENLRKEVGPRVASAVWDCKVFRPKKEEDDGWPKCRGMVERYERGEEEKRERERYGRGVIRGARKESVELIRLQIREDGTNYCEGAVDDEDKIVDIVLSDEEEVVDDEGSDSEDEPQQDGLYVRESRLYCDYPDEDSDDEDDDEEEEETESEDEDGFEERGDSGYLSASSNSRNRVLRG